MQNESTEPRIKEKIIYIDRIVQVLKPFYVDRPVYIDRIIEVEKDQKGNKKILGQQKIVQKIQFVEVLVQKIVQKEIRTETVVELPFVVEVVKLVQVIKQVPVQVRTEIQRPIEIVKEVYVQVPIEKIIEVPFEVSVEVIKYVEVPKIKILNPLIFTKCVHDLNKIIKKVLQEVTIECVEKFKINYRIMKIIVTVLDNFIYSRKNLIIPAAFEKIKALPYFQKNKRRFKSLRYSDNLQKFAAKTIQNSFDIFKHYYLEGYAIKKTAYIKMLSLTCTKQQSSYSRWHEISENLQKAKKTKQLTNFFEIINKEISQNIQQIVFDLEQEKIQNIKLKIQAYNNEDGKEATQSVIPEK